MGSVRPSRGNALAALALAEENGYRTRLEVVWREGDLFDALPLDVRGHVDVLVANRDGPAHLLRNVAPTGHWLALRVIDANGRDALGAQVTLVVAHLDAEQPTQKRRARPCRVLLAADHDRGL